MKRTGIKLNVEYQITNTEYRITNTEVRIEYKELSSKA